MCFAFISVWRIAQHIQNINKRAEKNIMADRKCNEAVSWCSQKFYHLLYRPWTWTGSRLEAPPSPLTGMWWFFWILPAVFSHFFTPASKRKMTRRAGRKKWKAKSEYKVQVFTHLTFCAYVNTPLLLTVEDVTQKLRSRKPLLLWIVLVIMHWSIIPWLNV